MKAAQAKQLKILNECNERLQTTIIDKNPPGGKQFQKSRNSNFYNLGSKIKYKSYNIKNKIQGETKCKL